MNQHSGNVQPGIDQEEHRSVGGVHAKAVVPYHWDGDSLVPGGAGLVPEAYDNIAITYPDTVTEVYTFKLAAATIAVITIVYTDTTKDFMSTVTRT